MTLVCSTASCRCRLMFLRKLWMWHYFFCIKTQRLLFLTAVLIAGLSVFRGDKGCIICGTISKDLCYCLGFIFCAWLSVISGCGADALYNSSQPSIPWIFSCNQFPSQSACHLVPWQPRRWDLLGIAASSLCVSSGLLDYRLCYLQVYTV